MVSLPLTVIAFFSGAPCGPPPLPEGEPLLPVLLSVRVHASCLAYLPT